MKKRKYHFRKSCVSFAFKYIIKNIIAPGREGIQNNNSQLQQTTNFAVSVLVLGKIWFDVSYESSASRRFTYNIKSYLVS